MCGPGRLVRSLVRATLKEAIIQLSSRIANALQQAASQLSRTLGATFSARSVREGRTNEPTVSIIVPFYDVEPYFAACLDSLGAQTYRNLELILVNDGSRDGSSDIAERYAGRDKRILVVRQENSGLGAARNAGLSRARGRFITFVDSDDLLPPGAISTMVKTLERTGSDFLVGALQRFEEGRKPQTPPWVTELHAARRLHIRVDDFPEILRNVFAWNKMFDRQFFIHEVGEFPVGVHYEDQEPTARAYLRGIFDVLDDTVYLWRRRTDQTSITQQKTDPADLSDRLEVKHRLHHLMSTEATPQVFETWLTKALSHDLRPYLEQVPRTELDFWRRLHDGMRPFFVDVPDSVWLRMSVFDRYPALCLRENRRTDLIRFIRRRDECGRTVPSTICEGIASVAAAYLEGMEFRPQGRLMELASSDLVLRTRLQELSWHDRSLVLSGFAYISNVAADAGESEIRLVAESEIGDTPFNVTQLVDDRVDEEVNDRWNTHRGSAFNARLDLHALRSADDSSTWRIRIDVVARGIARRGPVSKDGRRLTNLLPVPFDDSSGQWTLVFDRAVGLRLRYRPREPGAT